MAAMRRESASKSKIPPQFDPPAVQRGEAVAKVEQLVGLGVRGHLDAVV
jgi:hypothetical protein